MTEEEYQRKLEEIDAFFGNDVLTTEQEQIVDDVLAYEKEHFPTEDASTEQIMAFLEQQGIPKEKHDEFLKGFL